MKEFDSEKNTIDETYIVKNNTKETDILEVLVGTEQADQRFKDLDLTESQIEFIKAYEDATGQRFYVTTENMAAIAEPC